MLDLRVIPFLSAFLYDEFLAETEVTHAKQR